MFSSPEDVVTGFRSSNYLLDCKTATIIFLAQVLGKPLLVEGPAGVGKTGLAMALAKATNRELIRLQCYEGLDESKALYEWNYQQQLLFIQAQARQEHNLSWDCVKKEVYSQEFLLPRPLLQALISHSPVVLLIDELDKADEEMESLLLEALSEFQVSIPEIGTVQGVTHPAVIITSNNTRDLSDALKRRCLFLYLSYPDAVRELEIIHLKLPGIGERLARQAVALVQSLRRQELKKPPSIAETLDWGQALLALETKSLNQGTVQTTLEVLLKYQEDLTKVEKKLSSLLAASTSN